MTHIAVCPFAAKRHGHTTGSGAPLRRECGSVVRAIQNLGRTHFQDRCRVILLPGANDAGIPVGMEGLTRHNVERFDADALERLLRDLSCARVPARLMVVNEVSGLASPVDEVRSEGYPYQAHYAGDEVAGGLLLVYRQE